MKNRNYEGKTFFCKSLQQDIIIKYWLDNCCMCIVKLLNGVVKAVLKADLIIYDKNNL